MRFFPFGYYYFFLLVFIFIPFHTLWFYTYTHAHTHKYTRSLGINTYIDTLTATQITHLYNVQYGCWWNLHKHTCTYNTYKRSLLYLSRMVSVQLVWKNNTVWTRAKNLSIVPYWKCYRNTPTKFDETKSQLLARTQFTNAFCVKRCYWKWFTKSTFVCRSGVNFRQKKNSTERTVPCLCFYYRRLHVRIPSYSSPKRMCIAIVKCHIYPCIHIHTFIHTLIHIHMLVYAHFQMQLLLNIQEWKQAIESNFMN